MNASGATLDLKFPVQLRGRYGDPKSRIDAVVGKLLSAHTRPRVLEAGCGSSSRVELPPGRHLVGIDIAQRQLDDDAVLDEKHLGDLQTFMFPGDGFDAILCWDVSNTCPAPSRRWSAWRTPSIRARWCSPFQSVLAKSPGDEFSPYKVHERFYRYIIGDKRQSAGWDQFGTTFRHPFNRRRDRGGAILI